MNPAITRILVPTDFGAASNVALDYAITIARRFGASLRLLHVVDDPAAAPARWGSEVYIGCSAAIRDALIDEAATKLYVLLARAGLRGTDPLRGEGGLASGGDCRGCR